MANGIRTPKKLRVLQGNPGRRKIKEGVKAKKCDSVPKPPRRLDKVGKAEWRRVASALHGMGLLTEVDLPALEMYCTVYSRWVEAERILAENGVMIGMKVSPWYKIANDALARLDKFLAAFGLTPASRAKLDVEPATEEDPYEQFLKSAKDG